MRCEGVTFMDPPQLIKRKNPGWSNFRPIALVEIQEIYDKE
jgi:hypothetical protein